MDQTGGFEFTDRYNEHVLFKAQALAIRAKLIQENPRGDTIDTIEKVQAEAENLKYKYTMNKLGATLNIGRDTRPFMLDFISRDYVMMDASRVIEMLKGDESMLQRMRNAIEIGNDMKTMTNPAQPLTKSQRSNLHIYEATLGAQMHRAALDLYHAVVAAGGQWSPDITRAIRNYVQRAETFENQPALKFYEETYVKVKTKLGCPVTEPFLSGVPAMNGVSEDPFPQNGSPEADMSAAAYPNSEWSEQQLGGAKKKASKSRRSKRSARKIKSKSKARK